MDVSVIHVPDHDPSQRSLRFPTRVFAEDAHRRFDVDTPGLEIFMFDAAYFVKSGYDNAEELVSDAYGDWQHLLK